MMRSIEDMAAASLRCVFISYRLYEMENLPKEEERDNWALPESELILLGIVGIKVATTHPFAVSECNTYLETLIFDKNVSIVTLAITTLLKTCDESRADFLIIQISNFMLDNADEFKIVFVEAIRLMCLKFPFKHPSLMDFLGDIFSEEGGFEYKKAIIDSIVILIRDTPEAKETGLLQLCEFIKDCEFTDLSTQVDPATAEAEEGVEDEYQLEELEVVAADYIMKLFVSNFKNAWEIMSPDYEREDEYAHGVWESLSEAVSAVINILDMQSCEGTEVVSDYEWSHTCLLAGVFIDKVLVLVRLFMFKILIIGFMGKFFSTVRLDWQLGMVSIGIAFLR